MREALHIFRKDTRQLRVAIAVVLGWTAVFAIAWSSVDIMANSRRPLSDAVYALNGLAYFVFPALWAYLVSQVVHAEALPGDRQFWLTRPYHRGSLAAAKALFVLAYLSGPLLLAQLAILLAQGFPLHAIIAGLIWTQVIMIAVAALPAAALASLTTTLPQFVLGSILAPVCAVLIATLGSWGSFEWVRLSAVGVEAALVSAAVVALQYAARRTRTARLIGLAGILGGLTIAVFLPWPFAMAVQHRVAPERALPVTARIERPRPAAASPRPGAPLRTWVALDGIPEGMPLRCEGGTVAITAASTNGPTWTSPLRRYAATGVTRDGGCPITMPIPQDVRAAFGETPVTVRATVYVTVFGPPETNTIARQSAHWIPSVGLCRTDTIETTRVVEGRVQRTPATALTCLAPFRRPSSFVEISRAGAPAFRTPNTRPSFSPFPADFGFIPKLVVNDGLEGTIDFTVRTREPIAHFRRTAEISDVRVPDFDVSVRPDGPPQ